MIVEFMGASGAGKTRLVSAVQARLSSAITAWDMALDRPHLLWMTQPTARNLAAEVVTLPAVLKGWSRYQPFLSFSRQVLSRNARTTFERLNYHRSIIRKVGMHELARRRGKERLVLADEGTLLIAYYLFVYTHGPLNEPDLRRFVELVPHPDLVVHVKAPLEELVDRALSRPDRRRELVDVSRSEQIRWIERAVDVFDWIAAALDNKVPVVQYQDSGADDLALKIAGFVGATTEVDPPPSKLRSAEG
ncbi:MAG: hypothetical protein ACT4OP_13370 [Actinomycetota bacterium]